ncbi:hypothetical protein PoB_000285400 [Plakobranchus ocellatus]|uniref:Regulatory protein zeste n=1 Tax=Plakobranchus ocellatus TaxID=259542 RepID=A0AAV3Y078_9GAST|nr:hypothetical protein PoB_000285400 [Plakobranchus ocellatus]
MTENFGGDETMHVIKNFHRVENNARGRELRGRERTMHVIENFDRDENNASAQNLPISTMSIALVSSRKRSRGKQREKLIEGLTDWLKAGKSLEAIEATKDRKKWRTMIANAVKQGT